MISNQSVLFAIDDKSPVRTVASSSDILCKLRSHGNTDVPSDTGDSSTGDVQSNDVQLISDMLSYLRSRGGMASTKDIVQQFKQNLPIEHTMCFKSMLKQIC